MKEPLANLARALVPVLLLVARGAGAAGDLPDLLVSQIATPGGLKVGDCNSIRATIRNSQPYGVSDPVEIQLRLVFADGRQGQYTTTLENGIGSNGNLPAWFNGVSLPQGNVQMVVVADPEDTIAETEEMNNSRSLTRTVSESCDATTARPGSYALSPSGAADGHNSVNQTAQLAVEFDD